MTVHPCVSISFLFRHTSCAKAVAASTTLFDAIRELFVGAAPGRDIMVARWGALLQAAIVRRIVAAWGRSYKDNLKAQP